MIEAFQQNLADPIGLTALLALIPLLIFYLVKPRPEEEVMPSMTFFMEEKRDGKIRNALRTLRRNNLLLLHIFFVAAIATAIANPLVPGLESEGETVVIVDTSASVSDNKQEVQKFAVDHLGNSNTIIRASSTTEVLAQDASTERARSLIRSQRNTADSTDLVSALQLASNYPGRIVVASDLAHNSAGEIRPVLDELASERSLRIMDLDHRNSHGFTDVEVMGKGARITVQNFLDRNRSVEIEKPGENREVTLPPSSTRTITVELEPGTHELRLPVDEFAMDNYLYINMPENRGVDVAVLGEESQYFREAVELINFTSYRTADGFSGADVYFVSSEYEIGNVEKLRQELGEGKAVIVEGREGLEEILPVENRSGSYNAQVEISQGMTTQFNSTVFEYDVTGRSLSRPQEAIVLSEESDVLLYNVDDQSFGKKIAYPIFWKKIMQRMTDVKTSEELNLETGRQINFQERVNHKGQRIQGYTRLESTGFYRGQEVFAVNLLNAEESAPQINTASSRIESMDKPSQDPSRKYLSALLALIAGLEITYLARRGELKS